MLTFSQHIQMTYIVSYFEEPYWNFQQIFSVIQFDLKVINLIRNCTYLESMDNLKLYGNKKKLYWKI